MAIFKCKMCGGQLEVSEGMTVCECEYCGTQQTLPKNHDDVLTNLFNRANNLRMKSEFDKAQEIYEKIVANNATESEAYWGIVLCKYGIEYVEDPATLSKVPTCHRTQLESVMTDVDYQAALDNSDTLQRSVYEREAAAIDKLQKDILAIVHKEKPFDVFICYKESDENGKRTPDSVIANDIYHQLTQEGFKVFYAAITLEDKLGQEYEPYIFAALNSAKVMLAVGTKPEYFNAVWVKNEWSRYLKLIKSDRSRLLIPCYRDMDAYDLPEEFSHLQAQDMGKIGFVNDVIRGIRKVLVKDEPKPAAAPVPTVVQASSVNVENLLKRGNLALEDGKWENANNFFEQVLNENVEEPRAYYGKMLADLNIRSSEHLEKMCYEAGISDNDNYRKAIRFGDDAMKQNLETLHKQTIYNYACAAFDKADDRNACMEAKSVFEKIAGFKDSSEKIKQCDEKGNANDLLIKNAIETVKKYVAQQSGKTITMQLAEAKEQLLSANKQLEQIDSRLSAVEYMISRVKIEEIKEDLKVADSELRALSNERSNIKNQYDTKIAEIDSLGLFKKKQKEQLRSEAEELNRQREELNNRYNEKKNAYEEEKNAKRKYEININDRMQLLTEKKNLIEKIIPDLQKRVETLKSEMENGKIINETEFDSAQKIIKKEYSKGNEDSRIRDCMLHLNNFDDQNKIGERKSFIRDSIKKGNKTVFFGRYEWYIIEQTSDSVKLLCKQIVTELPYINGIDSSLQALMLAEEGKISWQESYLRKWLNTTFYNEFTKEEKALISDTYCKNAPNSDYNTDGGKDTIDKVYLLSLSEVENINCKKCDQKSWWLRSPGSSKERIAIVDPSGLVNTSGLPIYRPECGVRPALTLKFEE